MLLFSVLILTLLVSKLMSVDDYEKADVPSAVELETESKDTDLAVN